MTVPQLIKSEDNKDLLVGSRTTFFAERVF